ncbi:MAG TPA: AMP-binding protein [Burkholderiaceae bacterium]|nr:AMP-binding protein [Burkholderiaceae bacterium]
MTNHREAAGAYWNAELETLAWDEVERWQAGRIAAMLPALRQRSRLYARLHADLSGEPAMRDLADLASLPFTLKDEIRIAQERSSPEQPFGDNQAMPSSDIVQAISSSGTTGAPLYYALTARDVEIFADAIANVWFTAGIRRGDTVAHLVGLPMVAGGLPYADGFRRVGATLCWLGGFPTERILRDMRRLRVTALLATTSFALYLAARWDDVGRETGLPSSLTKVLGGGEPGLGVPDIRTRIERGLGLMHLRETMGLGDVLPSMWGECEVQDGMHFNAQRYVAVELIDPASGQRVPWSDGATGELVYTAFDRDATPLVRYRSRDHARVSGVRCACGRTSPRIRCIGRTDDMLIYRGMNVFPSAIRDRVLQRFADRVEPILRIVKDHKDQVRFDDALPLEVESPLALDDAQRAALAAEIEADIRNQLQVRVAVTVLPPDSLPRGTYKNALVAVRDPAKGTPP